MVFQNYALFPHMKCPPQRRLRPEDAPRGGGGKPTRRVEAALALVRLQGQADKLPASSPADSSSGSPSRGRSSSSRPSSSWTSRSPTSMPSSGSRCASRSAASMTSWLDHDLRHPRPGRGAVARRPHRGHARRDDPPGWQPERALRNAGPSRRRRVHGFSQSFRRPARGSRRRSGDRGSRGRAARRRLAGAACRRRRRRPDGPSRRPHGRCAAAPAPSPRSVETIEYRGREFVGTALTAKGTELFFRSARAARASRGRSTSSPTNAGR